jgi:uncharacterized metal-binding protein
LANCVFCKDKDCRGGKDCFGIEVSEYNDPEAGRIMKAAAKTEVEGYRIWPRLKEIAFFAREMGIKRIGVAFCIGLSNEAERVVRYLSRYFEVHSVVCKNCGIYKERYQLPELPGGSEAMCNPIGQAKVLANEKTELNIIVGLCLGHDILFTRYSKAPVTTFIVKDRLLAHNPAAALFSHYHWDKLIEEEGFEGVKGEKENG